MKRTITLLFAATTVTFAVVCLVQSRKSATQEIQLAALRTEVEARSVQAEEAQAAQQRADRQRKEAAAQAEELTAQLRSRQLAANSAVATTAAPAAAAEPAASEPAKPDSDVAGFGKMISKMMQDPDTRELVRNQQRMMMNQLYAPLVKQMGLTADEAAQFKDLLADHAMKGAEKAFSAVSSTGSSNRTEQLKTMTADFKSFDEEVKAFLGDDRYAQYKEYQETLGERTVLNQFKVQTGGDYNLTDPQTEALLTFMKEEKKSVAAATGLPMTDGGQDKAKLMALLTGDKLDELINAQQTVNQRVYDRARTILSADQLQTLSKFQTNQMQMTRMGLTMAKKMFGADKPSAATPAQ